jgi:hypothetical protein
MEGGIFALFQNLRKWELNVGAEEHKSAHGAGTGPVRSGDSTLGRTFLGVRSGDRTLLRPLVLSIHNSTMPVQVRSGDWTLLRPPIPFIHNHISRLQVRTRPELHSITPNHNSIVPLFHFEVFHKPHSLSDPPIWQGGLSLDFHYRCGYIEHRKVW